jgi:hypothetical protein
MPNRNTHMSSRKQEGGAGASKTTRMTKHTLRQTGPRGEHRGRSSGSASRRRSGSKSNPS